MKKIIDGTNGLLFERDSVPLPDLCNSKVFAKYLDDIMTDRRMLKDRVKQ